MKTENEKLKEFWLNLSLKDRKMLLKIEKQEIIKKMKQRQKCSCTVCGKRKSQIEQELELLCNSYYQESIPNLVLDDDQLSLYSDISESSSFYSIDNEFPNNLLLEDGSLTVADELLKSPDFLDILHEYSTKRPNMYEKVHLTELERMEEGKRMFQIFASKIFEHRLVQGFREHEAEIRALELVKELDLEEKSEEKKQRRKRKKEKERKQREERLEKERLEQLRLDQQKREKERLEQLEKERIQKEALEKIARDKRAAEELRQEQELRQRLAEKEQELKKQEQLKTAKKTAQKSPLLKSLKIQKDSLENLNQDDQPAKSNHVNQSAQNNHVNQHKVNQVKEKSVVDNSSPMNSPKPTPVHSPFPKPNYMNHIPIPPQQPIINSPIRQSTPPLSALAPSVQQLFNMSRAMPPPGITQKYAYPPGITLPHQKINGQTSKWGVPLLAGQTSKLNYFDDDFEDIQKDIWKTLNK